MIPDNLPEKLAFDYEFIEKIGEGANGETWLAEHRFTRTKAAIKCLKHNKVDDIKTLELFKRESELLKSVKVSGVPQFYDYYPPEDNGNGYLVQEFIQAPSILDFLIFFICEGATPPAALFASKYAPTPRGYRYAIRHLRIVQ